MGAKNILTAAPFQAACILPFGNSNKKRGILWSKLSMTVLSIAKWLQKSIHGSGTCSLWYLSTEIPLTRSEVFCTSSSVISWSKVNFRSAESPPNTYRLIEKKVALDYDNHITRCWRVMHTSIRDSSNNLQQLATICLILIWRLFC